MDQNTLTLPIQATGRADIGRLLREAQAIDNFLKQAAIREPGTPVKMPKTSRLMDEFTSGNKLNLLHDEDRAKVLNFLIMVKAKAPVLHMSFSVDPAPTFVQKITEWLRQEIHPLILLQVGLQPNIGAGCVVRSTNKYFDFSLREHFKKQKPLLMQKLHGDMQKSPVEATAEAAEEQVSVPQPAEPVTAEAASEVQPAEENPTAPVDNPPAQPVPSAPEPAGAAATPPAPTEQEAPHA